jgi:Xaa-Pro aminopeptidase
MATSSNPREEDLSRFREVQRLAYECVTHVERELRPGMTERDAARAMHSYLAARGVRHYFHKPFAWFGDRTAFEGLWTPLHFFPTGRRLERGMPVILDVAPTVDGYAADIGYALAFGDNPLWSRMMADLQTFRTLILEGVRKEKTLQAIYREVDALIADLGYANRHRRYPYAVLAHRVDRLQPGLLGRVTLGGFGAPALRFLGREAAAARRGLQHSPLWNGTRFSAHRATPGLWAVEPHLGKDGVGAKWEELLVVTDTDARWLDDDLPHVRRWASAAQAA